MALVLCMGASLLPVAPVLAQEDSAAQSAVETEQAVPQAETAGESNSDDTTGGDVPADVAVSGEIAAETSAEPDGSLTEDDSAAEETILDDTEEPDNDALAPTEDDAFQLEVSFAGQTLQEKTTNAIAAQWDVTTAQSLQVTLKRDTAVELEASENKQYVLCLKTTEDFYFTALPEIDKIDGAEEMEFVQNTSSVGAELNPYSGELRIRINPDAETVNLGVLGVKVSDSVAAAAGTGLTVYSPVSVQLVTADASLKLKDMKDSDKTKVHGYSVDTAKLVNPAAGAAATAEPSDEDTTTGEEEIAEPRVVDEEAAFSVAVTFAEQSLTEDGANNVTSAWDDGKVPTMEVTITRNRNVDVDPNKQYVLCMKTSDVFYFNGVPDVSTITGADEAVMIPNETPTVSRLIGGTLRQGALENFSAYSGEIRVKINPSTDVVTITDIGVSYNPALVGYTNGKQTIADPIDVQLVSVDGTKTLSGMEESDKHSLHEFPINSVDIKTAAAGGGLRVFNSMDNFSTYRSGTTAKLSKDDTICYVVGSQKQTEMVYKDLTFVLHLPYVEIDSVKHYLSFDEKDTAITSNKKGNVSGYPLKNNTAIYDADQHTITYEFENIYMTSWNNAVYTPTFGWPDELKDTVIDQNYIVKGLYWEVTEKNCYTGALSSFVSSWPSNISSVTTDTVFTSSTPEIILQTDHTNPSAGLGVPMIYKDVNLQTGYGGFLGFFDVHNEGAGDSPKVKIDITFNDSNGSGATYYITRMVLPSDSPQVIVHYTLENVDGNQVTGDATYDVTSSFSCRVTDLIQDYNKNHNSSLGNDYYIKELTYETVLRKNKLYHSEVIHSGRNSLGAVGTYQGYMSGNVGQTAGATMTITPVDEDASLNTKGDKTLTATEISTISELDFIADTFGTATLDGQSSTNITAGSDTTLNFNVSVMAEEYPINGKVGGEINGYHVMRDGIFYICLPEGVSIAGPDQVHINVGYSANKNIIDAEKVEKLQGTQFTMNGITACWWKFEASGLNVNGHNTGNGFNTVYVSITLSTDISMAGVNWSFNNCIAVGTNGQKLSRTGDSVTNKANTAAELKKLNFDSANALANYLPSNADNLGLNLYRANTSVNLNIARAEAKLDVATALSTTESGGNNDQAAVSNEKTDITYAVTVSCAEGGAAKNFNYYIPIVHTDSALDTGALVSKREFGLTLSKVDITPVGNTTASSPFVVYYTTDGNLNSTTIQGDDVTWSDSVADLSKVTAVKITTKTDAEIKEKEAYRFDVVMQYDNKSNDFERQAGSVVQWRSFGHYTYHTQSGAETTNSYPSDDNSVRIRYVKDLTNAPFVLTLDTSAADNSVNVTKLLDTTFVNDQKLSIKEVKASNGTVLTTDNPTDFTGADANSKFRMEFKINEGDIVTFPNKGNGWKVDANTEVNMTAGVRFSRALTDTATPRYVDIVLGNDDINITCRVQLNRKVIAASADKSGVAVGENFMVPTVGASCNISRDSSFTALYVVENFVPGNFSGQVLQWQDGSGSTASFPTGTTITMMEISDDNAVTSYWYYKPNGSSVNLNEFTRMAGTGKYSYDTTATASTTLRYMFVVNFGQAQAAAGSYKLVLDADAKNGVAAFTPVELDVTLGAAQSYRLAASSTADVEKPTATVDYSVIDAAGNDSYSEGRSLSLVLSAKDHTELPQDAQIAVGDTVYSCNGTDCIIIPIGTIATGQKVLALKSQMFPEKETSYTFEAVLYLSKSRQDVAPMNGNQVASCEITFTKSAEDRPALRVTGNRVATLSDWVSGQNIGISVEHLDGCEITLNAYSGITGEQRVTNLLSSVSGVFTFKDGVGSYDSSRDQTGILTLNPDAKPGTYRLSFKVTKDGKTVMTVPYYIIVR